MATQEPIRNKKILELLQTFERRDFNKFEAYIEGNFSKIPVRGRNLYFFLKKKVKNNNVENIVE